MASWKFQKFVVNGYDMAGPSLTLQVTSPVDVQAVYAEEVIPLKGSLEVHAYLDTVEIIEDFTITEFPSEAYKTPLTITDLAVGAYTVNSRDQAKGATIAENQTTRIDFQFITPKPPMGYIEVHAFQDNVEVNETCTLVETGETFTTPVTLEVTPATYNIQVRDQTKTAVVTENQTVIQNFNFTPDIYYTLTVTQVTGGTINAVSGSYLASTSVPISVTPASGYTFTNWVVDGENADGGNSLLMNADHTLTAVFTPIPPQNYTLQILAPTGSGSTNPTTGSYIYTEGTGITITAIPSSGWIYDHLIVDGGSVTQNPLNIVMNSDHTVQAVFTQIIMRVLTIVAPSGQGSTDPVTGAYGFLNGDIAQIIAYEASGWQFSHWLRNGVQVNGNPLSFTVNADYLVQAVFTEIPLPQHQLSITVNGQATSPIVGYYTYTQGDTVHLIAVPATNWVFSNWVIDGVGPIATSTYDIVMNIDHTVVATFIQLPREDELVYTDSKTKYTAWYSPSLDSFYVKDAKQNVVAEYLVSLQKAIDWIIANAGIISIEVIAIGGALLALFLSGRKKGK